MHLYIRSSKDIGVAIRNQRKKRGLSQAQLASMSGVWQETISKIENSRPGAKLDTVFELLAALDLELALTKRRQGSAQELEELF